MATILVNLRNDWFAPNGSLYLAKDNPHEFPAEWEDQIPRIKVPKASLDAPAETEYVVDKEARDSIIVSDNPRVVATLQNTANGASVVVATAVGDEVESVGGALDNKGMEQPHLEVAEAAKGADALNVDVGGKPMASGPLPAGANKMKK